MTLKEIEQLVDNEIGSRPLATVDFLEAIAAACHNTAAHVEETWQDRNMAKAWRRVAKAVEKASSIAHTEIP